MEYLYMILNVISSFFKFIFDHLLPTLILIYLLYIICRNYKLFSSEVVRNIAKKIFDDYIKEIALVILVTIVFSILKKNNDEINSDEPIIEYLIIFILIIFSVFFMIIKDLEKINFIKIKNKLNNISNKKLQSIAKYYIPKEVEKIEQTLSNLITSGSTETILWELKYLQLEELEKDDSFKKLDDTKKENMLNNIFTMRRKRITRIANGLISEKSKYYTTETNKPSSLADFDTDFWDSQKRLLDKKKPSEARRYLIISKNELFNEYNKHIDVLKNYIEFNNYLYSKDKSVIFHIIVYFDTIKDVFCDTGINSNLYDFTISIDKNKKTVFAQSSNTVNNKKFTSLSAFDSERNINDLKKYTDWYDKINKMDENKIKQNSYCTKKKGGYIKSPQIKKIEDIKKFIDTIQNY